MDNEQERNEHFKGFAELLYQDLSKLEGSHETLISEYRNKYDKQAIIRLIAQRAYDLMEHIMLYAPAAPVPDMTEWP